MLFNARGIQTPSPKRSNGPYPTCVYINDGDLENYYIFRIVRYLLCFYDRRNRYFWHSVLFIIRLSCFTTAPPRRCVRVHVYTSGVLPSSMHAMARDMCVRFTARGLVKFCTLPQVKLNCRKDDTVYYTAVIENFKPQWS